MCAVCRGRLADQASRHLSATNTDQLLWETELTRQLKANGRAMKAEVQIRITGIVCTSPEHVGNPKSPHAPRVMFIRGTVVASDTLDIPRGPVAALLRLNDYSASTGRKMLSPEVGRDVHAWRPWTSIICASDEGDVDAKPANVWCFPRFHVFEARGHVPAPFPMPFPSPPDAR